MEQLIKFINRYTKLNQETIASLEECVKVEEYKKNAIILSQGQYCNKLWFIKKGLVRKFHLHDGKEITSWMHCENDIFTSVTSYFQNGTSDEFLQACEDTITLSISKEKGNKLTGLVQIELFVKLWIEESLAKLDAGNRKFNLMSATEKYEYLKIISPQIVQRAKLGHIASIIGVTQETLSRIRANK